MPQQHKKENSSRLKPSARRKARQLALQALYQWQMTQLSVDKIEAQFKTDNDMSKIDEDYFNLIIHGVPRQINHIDEAMTPALDRPLDQLDPVELAVLRIGCYELVNQPDVPYRVVINEAIELVKRFGAQDSHRYINGILDKLAPRLRAKEVLARKQC
ncbi:MAG: transcription antitermination factor NusB [Endozoicomonas sp. (ex Botrylloides leachii)]|nr:transcription antitermination factor NusB [Endozoicomonas sp. (ex Botrylloides leachii)]